MKIIVLKTIFTEIKSTLSGRTKSVSLYGRSYKKEKICNILSLKPNPELKKVATARKKNSEIHFYVIGQTEHVKDIEVIPFQTEYASRTIGIIDTETFSKKTVGLVGLGSVGSVLAVYLAEASVGGFRLNDMDDLAAANLSRHACNLYDLGRKKTNAVRDLILARNPYAQIETFEDDFLNLDFEQQIEIFSGLDLVIATTDSNACQFAVNEVCLHLRIPSLFIGCYERAHAGEVIYVIPGVTPCFNCVVEFRSQTFEEVDVRERHIPYSDETDTGFQAEPGLSVDIGYVTSVAAAYALALLEPDSSRGKSILSHSNNLILLHGGSKPIPPYSDIFNLPFDFIKAQTSRVQRCKLCQAL